MTSAIKKFDKILDQNPDIEKYLRNIYNDSANWKIDARLEYEKVKSEQKAKGSGHVMLKFPLFGTGVGAVFGAGLSISINILKTDVAWYNQLFQQTALTAAIGAGFGSVLALSWAVSEGMYDDLDFTPKKTAAIKELKQRASNHRPY